MLHGISSGRVSMSAPGLQARAPTGGAGLVEKTGMAHIRCVVCFQVQAHMTESSMAVHSNFDRRLNVPAPRRRRPKFQYLIMVP